MISVEKYNYWKETFFEEYERNVRNWLIEEGTNPFFAYNMPFFRDGVVCPEKWFSNNGFRPLFILKEVNTGLKTDKDQQIEEDIEGYNEKWGTKDTKYFNFVENEFDDIRIGKFATWKKVVRLSIKLEKGDESYREVNLNVEGGTAISMDAPRGYREGKFKYTTGNTHYINAVNKIAVIDIKKIGGGETTDSWLSKQGKPYMDHLMRTSQQLIQQVSIIEPTVIISCCGPDNDQIYEILAKSVSKKMGRAPSWYKANHPSYFSGEGKSKEIEFCESIERF